jgi:hypothetical protein
MISDKTLKDAADWALVVDYGLGRALALELTDLRERSREMVDALGWALESLKNPPVDPGHTCTPGITGCDGDCVDWAHFCDELAKVRSLYDTAREQLPCKGTGHG